MKIKILILLSATLLGGCFDEDKSPTIEPETMADCIAIENPNDRDICKMKMDEKTKKQAEDDAKSMESVGDQEFKTIEW
ncbi:MULTISPECIES: hypothetical protein [Methylophaga]|uniref:Entry exclusion lipoprotein TrbK n=1 Tax=Methylophaga thalassica TaxID=40223 RepID=A0ABQ5TYW1_9GAMM|nr:MULTISPECIES: hypothetical protein [Methylophaga]AUZ86142.1 hypothetical protein CDW43_15940 [Methylophaga nitratireducenticrescens]GLQ00597.1 hypothetical protein GCM10007891_24500 [Methylophaga thalassica]